MTHYEVDVAGTPYRLSWPALFGGMFAALGTWLLLHVFGLAIGMSTIDASDPSTLRTVGIGGGVWSAVASMLALVVGGFVTARSAGILGRDNAVLHGIVLWGMTTLFALLVGFSIASAIARGTAQMAGAAASGAREQLPQLASSLGLDAQDAVEPINQRRAAAGKPPLSAQAVQSAIQDALRQSMRGGEGPSFDAFISRLSPSLGVSPPELRQVFGNAEERISQHAQTAATKSVEVARAAFWGLFALLALSLVAAIVGAIAGLSRAQRVLSDRVRADIDMVDMQRPATVTR